MPTSLPEESDKKRPQTLGEEIANAITHGVGLLMAIIGMVVLIVKAATQGDALHIVACSVFGATMVLLYAASTLYHSVQTPRVKKWLRVFDHTAIYLLIAGTYTPFTLVSMQGGWGWSLFGAVWALAALGIIFKLTAFGRFKKLSMVLYLGMGWLAVLAVKPLFEMLPPAGFALLAAGGLTYTLGVVFYVMQKKRFFHTIWHLFVMGGTACHYAAVLLFVVPSASVM